MEQQNSMQPQTNMQGQENGQYVPGYDTQSNMSPYNVQQMQFGETQQQKERKYSPLWQFQHASMRHFIRFFCTTIIKVLRCRFLL